MTNPQVICRKYIELLSSMGDKDFVINRLEKTMLTMIIHGEHCSKVFDWLVSDLEKEKRNEGWDSSEL